MLHGVVVVGFGGGGQKRLSLREHPVSLGSFVEHLDVVAHVPEELHGGEGVLPHPLFHDRPLRGTGAALPIVCLVGLWEHLLLLPALFRWGVQVGAEH